MDNKVKVVEIDQVREKLIELPIDDAIFILKEELKQRSDGYGTHLANGGKGDPAEEVSLDALAMAISTLEQTKWIPVTERLPKKDGKYLVFEQSGGRTVTSVLRFAKDARKVDRYDFKGRWKNAWYEYDSEWGHYTVGSVTHWMPLPEPPKEG
jgi:hypothetical protein